jgi:hypothetical protein
MKSGKKGTAKSKPKAQAKSSKPLKKTSAKASAKSVSSSRKSKRSLSAKSKGSVSNKSGKSFKEATFGEVSSRLEDNISLIQKNNDQLSRDVKSALDSKKEMQTHINRMTGEITSLQVSKKKTDQLLSMSANNRRKQKLVDESSEDDRPDIVNQIVNDALHASPYLVQNPGHDIQYVPYGEDDLSQTIPALARGKQNNGQLVPRNGHGLFHDIRAIRQNGEQYT